MLSYTSGATTDRGDVRTENQDSILLLTGNMRGRAAALFAVADGMGGLSHGALVSRYITTQFERWWQEDFLQLLENKMDCEENIRELLEQEIWDINQAVLDFKNRLQCRSGSTLSLLLLYNNRYYIENIGDSRVYLFRGKRLYQLTSDQSLAADLVRTHRMTEEEAKHSRVQNVLTMCVGMFPVPQSGYISGKMLSGDCFLLCSDGLYHQLEQVQIEMVLRERSMDAREKANRLRGMIGQGKANDNVSVIIVEVKREKASGKDRKKENES